MISEKHIKISVPSIIHSPMKKAASYEGSRLVCAKRIAISYSIFASKGKRGVKRV